MTLLRFGRGRVILMPKWCSPGCEELLDGWPWRSARRTAIPAASRQQLFYLLQWTPDARGFGVTVHKGRDPESAEELWTSIAH
jgi:hypothetical protein